MTIGDISLKNYVIDAVLKSHLMLTTIYEINIYYILKSNLFTVLLGLNMILCKQINYILKVCTKVLIGYIK